MYDVRVHAVFRRKRGACRRQRLRQRNATRSAKPAYAGLVKIN